MRTHRRRRSVATALALLLASLSGPAAALAVPADSFVPSSAAAQTGAKVGDTPAEFGRPVASSPKAGDTPADFPGASRAPQHTPPATIAVVRPERTIVRDTDPVLPIALAGAALLVALGTAGAAVRSGRPHLGRTA
jgi:hypothetical protein